MISDVLHDAAREIDDYIDRGMYGETENFPKDPLMTEVIRLREQMLAVTAALDTIPEDTDRLNKHIQNARDIAKADGPDVYRFAELRRLALLRMQQDEEEDNRRS